MNRSSVSSLVAAVGFALVTQVAFGQGDCADEAMSNLESGRAASEGGDYAAAVESLSLAAGACDKAMYWQALGDAHQSILSAAEEGDEGAAASALEAYGNAFAAARRAQDDAAGGEAARSIVELGLLTNDPLKSQNWLMVATQLDPEHPDIPTLQTRLDEARAELSTSEIDTGLSQTRGIGLVNNLLGGDVTAQAFWDAPEESEEPEAEAEVAMATEAQEAATPAETRSSINIPIRFASNSTAMTGDTAANVQNLARVLSARPPSTSVILTGHADVRGDATYNLQLSLARAQAIRDLLIEQEPSLDGRIEALGDGETRPVDSGMSERSHANNRRLEVTILEVAQ